MNQPHCTHCGSTGLEPGFIEDAGEYAKGYARWIPGPLEFGPFGGVRRMGKRRFGIDAWRCTACSHLELFVRPS
ncbi:hypothetical protein [Nocardia huaxiensis]|uniref:Uncharacterized protein n=1 Tax=Nocardia huaxiensis TaxID=2755382 RepID=A0A7D6VDN2_9NOCA|nr:hypothetical protein [Nocardia huaxiensis]QLY32022.1 hypothetical protein H0264_06920 [Nocardia huaxiensis]UFS95596.1 hypothetical protein LPY97_33810 [Nocardia huaxiensis]